MEMSEQILGMRYSTKRKNIIRKKNLLLKIVETFLIIMFTKTFCSGNIV